MKSIAACLALLFLVPAMGQTAKSGTQDPARDAAAKRCKENRGADCDTREGLNEWLRQERAITPEEQSAAAGARRHRETCAANKKAPGC